MVNKSVKTAATVSIAVVALFVVVTVIFIAFQKSFLGLEIDVFAFPLTFIAYLAAAMCIIFNNILMISGKSSGIGSVVFPSVVLCLYPVLAQVILLFQNRMAAFTGVDFFLAVSSVLMICDKLSYLLMIGAVIAISTAAVNCCINKMNSKQEN